MRFALYMAGFSAVALGLGYALFVQNGIDPLAPEVRTIMLISLAVAGYIGLRLTLLVRGIERRASEAVDEGDGEDRRRSAFSRWGRSSALDARMDVRRERVRRAREAAEQAERDA
ncbi:MAG: hypothetical protein AAF253_07190 [Pseudomonadota bacterium]